MTRLCKLFVFLFLLSYNSDLLHAAPSHVISKAYIYNISYELTGDVHIDLALDHKEYYAQAGVIDSLDNSPLDYSHSSDTNWVSPLNEVAASFDESYGRAFAWSNPGDSAIYGYAHADPNSTSADSYAESKAALIIPIRSGQYGGSITISGSYDISTALDVGSSNGYDRGVASASASIQVGNHMESFNDYIFYEPADAPELKRLGNQGPFTLTLDVRGGETGGIVFNVLASSRSYDYEDYGPPLSSVPIPSAINLFGFGLLSLIGINRRR